MLEQAKPSVGFPLTLGVSWPLPACAWRASVLSDCDVFAAPRPPRDHLGEILDFLVSRRFSSYS